MREYEDRVSASNTALIAVLAVLLVGGLAFLLWAMTARNAPDTAQQRVEVQGTQDTPQIIAVPGTTERTTVIPGPVETVTVPGPEVTRTVPGPTVTLEPPPPATWSAPAGPFQGVGLVESLDPDARTITIRHDALQDARLSAGSTTFPVPDVDVLNGVMAGVRINFVVEKRAGELVVTGAVPIAP